MSDSLRVPSGPAQAQGPGEDPLYHYTRVFVRFLQLVFASFEKGNYRWDPDMQFTDIVISDQSTTSDVAEKRPSIIVARGPASFGNISMDQFSGPTFDRKGKLKRNLDQETGARRHTDLISASVSYNCLATEGVEAQRIAWIAMMATRRLKRSLMHAGMHRVGEEMQIGAESAPGSITNPDETEMLMVSVSVPFYFQDFWTIEPVDKVLLKNIDLALRSTINAAPGEIALNAPAINGRILEYDREKALSLTQRVLVSKAKSPKPRQ